MGRLPPPRSSDPWERPSRRKPFGKERQEWNSSAPTTSTTSTRPTSAEVGYRSGKRMAVCPSAAYTSRAQGWGRAGWGRGSWSAARDPLVPLGRLSPRLAESKPHPHPGALRAGRSFLEAPRHIRIGRTGHSRPPQTHRLLRDVPSARTSGESVGKSKSQCARRRASGWRGFVWRPCRVAVVCAAAPSCSVAVWRTALGGCTRRASVATNTDIRPPARRKATTVHTWRNDRRNPATDPMAGRSPIIR